MDNQKQNVAAPTAAPMTARPMATAYPAAATSRRIDAEVSARLMTVPAVGVNAHATGQVSFADAAFIKVWAPPPRRVSL